MLKRSTFLKPSQQTNTPLKYGNASNILPSTLTVQTSLKTKPIRGVNINCATNLFVFISKQALKRILKKKELTTLITVETIAMQQAS